MRAEFLSAILCIVATEEEVNAREFSESAQNRILNRRPKRLGCDGVTFRVTVTRFSLCHGQLAAAWLVSSQHTQRQVVVLVAVSPVHSHRVVVAACALHTQPCIPDTTSAALSIIRTQPSQYIVTSLGGRKYILTPRDLLTVPHLKDVKVGDVLALKDIREVGSRDYTLRGDPLIPHGRVKVEATVVEHTKGAMEVVFKKKRRKGYQKTIKNKHPYTRLRIGPIQFTDTL